MSRSSSKFSFDDDAVLVRRPKDLVAMNSINCGKKLNEKLDLNRLPNLQKGTTRASKGYSIWTSRPKTNPEIIILNFINWHAEFVKNLTKMQNLMMVITYYRYVKTYEHDYNWKKSEINIWDCSCICYQQTSQNLITWNHIYYQ